MTQRNLTLTNVVVYVIIVLYFSAIVIFEFIDPILTYREVEDSAEINWQEIFYCVYYLRFTLDFVVCLLILYLMHRFGPS